VKKQLYNQKYTAVFPSYHFSIYPLSCLLCTCVFSVLSTIGWNDQEIFTFLKLSYTSKSVTCVTENSIADVCAVEYGPLLIWEKSSDATSH
jgi:hypothetical protein